MAEQLDLLSWQPPRDAEILAFPQRRNRVRIRHVVELIEKRKTPDSRQRCFDRELYALCQALKANGLSNSQVDRQLDEFTTAVNLEIWRRDMRRQPGGAA